MLWFVCFYLFSVCCCLNFTLNIRVNQQWQQTHTHTHIINKYTVCYNMLVFNLIIVAVVSSSSLNKEEGEAPTHTCIFK